MGGPTPAMGIRKRLAYGFGFFALGLVLLLFFERLFSAALREGHGRIVQTGSHSFGLEGAGFLAAIVCMILGVLALVGRLPTIPTDWPQ